MVVSTHTRTLTFTRTVNAAPPLVYRAFTNAMAVREWLADSSYLEVRENGPLLLGWRAGYVVAGNYTALKQNERIAFTWQGRGEPGMTEVEVLLSAAGAGTEIVVRHSGIGDDPAWEAAAEEFRKGWESGLENLQSILETGLDQRIMRRPMLGIAPSPLDPKVAEKLGIPVEKGVYLDGVIEGGGAQKAGLRGQDVIVGIDGHPVFDFPSLVGALNGRVAGDTVSVDYYRGKDKINTPMTLSGRPAPDVPADPAQLAKRMAAVYGELDAELDALLSGVTDAEASHQPEAGEWNVKEVLAHLIWTERFAQMWAWGTVGGDDDFAWPDNNRMQLTPLLAVYGTAGELAAELKRAEAGTVAAVAAMPANVLQYKGSYLRLGQFITSFAQHTRDHFEQMRVALKAARG